MNIGDPALASAVRLVERLERELAANPIEAMQRNPSAWSAQVEARAPRRQPRGNLLWK